MKKLFLIFFPFYAFKVFATSYAEPVYYLNEKDNFCIYKTEGGLCKFCDSIESFRILPVAVIDENGNHIPLDEKICPQREVICDGECWSKLKNEKVI